MTRRKHPYLFPEVVALCRVPSGGGVKSYPCWQSLTFGYLSGLVILIQSASLILFVALVAFFMEKSSVALFLQVTTKGTFGSECWKLMIEVYSAQVIGRYYSIILEVLWFLPWSGKSLYSLV